MKEKAFAAKFRINSGDIKWKSQGATMTPSAFLSKALPFGEHGHSIEAVEKYREKIRAGETIQAPYLKVKRSTVSAGNHPAAFKVQGHDGRHRAEAARLEGVSHIPVEVIAHDEPRFPQRSEALKKAMKMPKHFQPQTKEFAGMLPDGYHLPAISRTKPDGPAIGTYAHPTQLYSDYQKEVKHNPSATLEGTFNLSPKQPGSSVSRLKKGGLITVPREGYFAGQIRGKGGDIPSDGRLRVLAHNGRRGVLKHEIAHSILQQKRGGAPDTVAGLAKEEIVANSRQFFGKKSPLLDRPLHSRIASAIRSTIRSTKYGVESMGIKKLFDSSLTHPTLGMALKNFQLPHDSATQPDPSERREFIKTGILGAGIAAGAGIGAGSDWFVRR